MSATTWRSDLNGTREWLSEAWSEFTGRALRVAAEHWTECLHPEDRERCAGIFRVCVAAGAPFTTDYRLLRADGTYRWCMDAGLPQYRDHVLTHYAGICVDFHARKLSADCLAERMRRLRLQERGRDAQLVGLTHDLRRLLAQRAARQGTASPSELLDGEHSHWSEHWRRSNRSPAEWWSPNPAGMPRWCPSSMS